jgi:hypothetical protein
VVTSRSSRVLLPYKVRLNPSEIGVLGYGPLGAVFGRRSTRALQNENAHSNPNQAQASCLSCRQPEHKKLKAFPGRSHDGSNRWHWRRSPRTQAFSAK